MRAVLARFRRLVVSRQKALLLADREGGGATRIDDEGETKGGAMNDGAVGGPPPPGTAMVVRDKATGGGSEATGVSLRTESATRTTSVGGGTGGYSDDEGDEEIPVNEDSQGLRLSWRDFYYCVDFEAVRETIILYTLHAPFIHLHYHTYTYVHPLYMYIHHIYVIYTPLNTL